MGEDEESNDRTWHAYVFVLVFVVGLSAVNPELQDAIYV